MYIMLLPIDLLEVHFILIRFLFSAVAIFSAHVMVSITYAHENSERSIHVDDNKFTLRLGNFNIYSINSAIRADSSSGILGAVLNFEKDLGVNNSLDTVRLYTDYVFSERHGVNVNYYSYKRKGSVMLKEGITFRDESFTVDRRIATTFKDTMVELGYEYALFMNERVSFDVGFGIRSDALEVELQSLVNPADTDSENERSVAKGRLYLPLVVFSGRLNFTPKLSMSTKLKQYLISVNPVEGAFSDFEFFLDYQLTPRYGLGFSLSQVYTDLEADDDDLRSGYENNVKGFFSYISVSF